MRLPILLRKIFENATYYKKWLIDFRIIEIKIIQFNIDL